jgi:hypothetical protein
MPVCNSRYAKLAEENRIIRRKYVLQRSLKEFIGEKYETMLGFPMPHATFMGGISLNF